MSRMLSYIAREPITTTAAVGSDLLTQFIALSRLHADGWGTAWVDPESGGVHRANGLGPHPSTDELHAALDAPSASRVVYLRFASRGAAPSPENSQPFLCDDLAFQHNGLISPREHLVTLLTADESSELHGTTDSEAYFAVIRRSAAADTALLEASAVARGVARVRSRFPDACLNAMLLATATLSVVHASGTARVPLAAFADRGFDVDTLPAGHDDDYNTLRTTVSATGARIVATTGIEQGGWSRLADESVFTITPEGVSGTRLEGTGFSGST